MPLMDEFKEERAEIKNRSLKEKLSYFWDYYKWHVIGGAIAIFAAVSLINSIVNQKETAFYACLLNVGQSLYSEDYKNEFTDRIGIDKKKEIVYFDIMPLMLSQMDDATVSTSQKILVYVSAGDLDVLVGDTQVTNHYGYLSMGADLRNFLSEEEYKKYEPYFYYMDAALIKEADGNTPTATDYPADPSDPSTMTDPVPVAIRIDGCKKFSEAYYLPGPTYFMPVVNTKHPELVHTFLDYVWED